MYTHTYTLCVLGGVLGLLFTSAAFGFLFATPVAGFLYQIQGNYIIPICLAGCCMIIGAVLIDWMSDTTSLIHLNTIDISIVHTQCQESYISQRYVLRHNTLYSAYEANPSPKGGDSPSTRHISLLRSTKVGAALFTSQKTPTATPADMDNDMNTLTNPNPSPHPASSSLRVGEPMRSIKLSFEDVNSTLERDAVPFLLSESISDKVGQPLPTIHEEGETKSHREDAVRVSNKGVGVVSSGKMVAGKMSDKLFTTGSGGVLSPTTGGEGREGDDRHITLDETVSKLHE